MSPGLTILTHVTLGRVLADDGKDLPDPSPPQTGNVATSVLHDGFHDSLVTATLITADGPMHWEIADHRTNRTGNNGTWKEQVDCLICGTTIE
jgi:hypothetical protein